MRPQEGLEKMQRREKPGAVERGREATREVLGMLWGSGSSQSRVSAVCWSPLAIGRFHEDCSGLRDFGICVALLCTIFY